MGDHYFLHLSVWPSLLWGREPRKGLQPATPLPRPPPKLRAALGWGVGRVRHLLEGPAEP